MSRGVLRGNDESTFPARLGRAGELLLVSSLLQFGENVLHVSDISDSFGYDIESTSRNGTRKIEVKASVPRTADQFHLTRNEYEKSKKHSGEGILVQVVFSSAIVTTSKVTIDDVEYVRAMKPASLQRFIPEDSAHFVWNKSALVRPARDAWLKFDVPLPTEFNCRL